jgi:hypothetical protein
MPQILVESRLLRITTSKGGQIKGWAEGVSLESDAGCAITQLLKIVAADRWKLAYEHRKQANRLFTTAAPYYRGRSAAITIQCIMQCVHVHLYISRAMIMKSTATCRGISHKIFHHIPLGRLN